MITLIDLVRVFTLVVEMVQWAKQKYGPNWDQALLEVGKGYAMLKTATSEEEANEALGHIHAGWTGKYTK